MLGDRIKELRAINKMTQKDLADFLGVTPKAVSFYELNQREPSTDIILKMAQRFNVSTDYLYGRPDVTQLPGYIGAVTENKKIPIIGTVKCGTDGLAFEDIDGYVNIDDDQTGEIFALRCKGDILEAANPDYPPRIFTGEDLNKIKIVGKVLETRRKR